MERLEKIIENKEQQEVLDYIEFIKYFGDNEELYRQLKSLKENSKSTWKVIRNLKIENIDLENELITIPEDEIDIC